MNTWDQWLCTHQANQTCGGWTGGIISNIDSMVQLTNLSYSGPGSWNDADMLQLCTYGKGHTPGHGMSLAEYRAHYAVWSVLASPLILSADLRTIEREHADCLQLMLNADIVAVNQDHGGHAARLVRQELRSGAHGGSAYMYGGGALSGGSRGPRPPEPTDVLVQVFARPLGTQPDLARAGGEVAVVLLNRDEEARELSVSWEELGLDDASVPLSVFDVIRREALPAAAVGAFKASVGAHDVAFVRLKNSGGGW